MSDLMIQVENLSKEYHLGEAKKSYDRLGDQIIDSIQLPIRRAGRLLRGKARSAADQGETIWALKDVSFKVQRGEVVGVIGRNGAGKSTLLKILSRITEPTNGYADIYGRVGSLLEVGTGFHPELTGRENIYLNGAILGMRKIEIDRRLDEIIDFAEIEKFIDTPVKHYSSGMYVRLAFSVAAHLEPEILMVDEVLAVGDIAFQKKCLGKMGDVAQQGRTVLFVSHNMGLIQTLCDRGIFIQNGCVAANGPITDAVEFYLSTLDQLETRSVAERTDRRGSGRFKLSCVEVASGDGKLRNQLITGQSARFSFTLNEIAPDLTFLFSIFDHFGQPITSFKSSLQSPDDTYDPTVGPRFICDVNTLLLLPGRYRIDVTITRKGELQDAIQAVSFFDVEEGVIDGRPVKKAKRVSVYIPHRWTIPSSSL